MSDLKHQSVAQLKVSKLECEKYISNLKSSLNGQKQRLEWINSYLHEKTPQELTILEIESMLGHKVIIKSSRG